MIDLIASGAVGTVAALAAYYCGHQHGRWDQRQALRDEVEPEEPIVAGKCACGHNVNSHQNRGKGRCNCLASNKQYNCACLFFVPAPEKKEA